MDDGPDCFVDSSIVDREAEPFGFGLFQRLEAGWSESKVVWREGKFVVGETFSGD